MNNLPKVASKLSPFGGSWWGAVRHAVALIRADKLFSTIYIAGTAVAIASAMVIAIVLNMLLADIPPESNRSRTLYLFGSFFTESVTAKGESPHIGLSSLALDSCLRQMNCVEAAMGDGSNTCYRFPASDERYSRHASVYAMPTDYDFFRIYDLDFLSGRPFSEKEFRDGERVVVISDKVRERLNLEGGSSILIDNLPFHVVGIVKPVSALMRYAAADVFLPYTIEELHFRPDREDPGIDGPYSGNMEVRILLRKGFSRQDFLDELEPLRLNYNAVCSAAAGEKVEMVFIVRSHFYGTINFFPTEVGDESTSAMALNLMLPTFLMLMFLLLPALNLSGLVTNRMEARRAEMGIRKAFGAKRRTLLREVISENLVLTLCGGLVGWVLSWLFILAIRRHPLFLNMFVHNGQTSLDTSLDFRMFVTPTLFLIVFLCCSVLNLMVALIPAWASLRKPIVESLNQKR